MRYYCCVCNETISERVYRYSMDKFGKALCMTHQKTHQETPFPTNQESKITPQAIRLSKALNDLQTITATSTLTSLSHRHDFIELDGMQHAFNPKQMIADDDRDKYSQKSGWTQKEFQTHGLIRMQTDLQAA